MSATDQIFLNIFKDLKIVPDKHNSSKNKTSYSCFMGEKTISYREVVELVKKYQDELIKVFSEAGSEV